ncbi:MAG TPA: hypothetical protein VFV87_06350, partial [Pirellulaceae bacterium]|nr:hypothetical protein [Pirellulaceae bacterium]
VLLLGVIGVLAILLLMPSRGLARPAANRVAAPPGAPASAAARAPTASASAGVQAGGTQWVAYEDAEKGFQAAFPGSQPQPIDPLAQIEDPQQRGLAEAMMKEWTVLGVTHGGRKYTLSAMPFDLGSIPPATYLDRMSAGLELIHQGFSVEPQPAADAPAPQRDFVLKKDDAGKLLRVVVGRGRLYQLLIEGDAGLGLGDPVAKEFFERFHCETVSSAPATSATETASNSDSDAGTGQPKPETEPRAGELPAEEPPTEIEWRPAQGTTFPFTIAFPGVTPAEVDPLAPLPEQGRATFEENWQRDSLVVESYLAEAGDRRYAVTAFRHPEIPAEESRRLIGQMVNLTSTYVRYLYPADRGRGYSAGQPLTRWQQWTTTSHTLEDGSKAIVRQAQLGYYGFVARVEGPAGMDDLDPLALRFINSLQPPGDAAMPPIDDKPPARPSAKTKTKQKSK